jgi:hypothetical protein
MGWLAALALALITGGCQSSTGGSLTGGGGPSPDFGHRAPPQSEPRVEDDPADRKLARRSKSAQALDDSTEESPAKPASRRASWRTGKDQQPAESKPLPVSDSADSSADDDLEL